MAQHFEWAHTSEGPTLVTPTELTELADDGNPGGAHGLAWGECMLYGTPEALSATLRAALALLDGPPLPSLPDPDTTDEEEEATCPYVYTEADAAAVRRANSEYVARMREVHGAAANIYEQPVPTPGEVCGAELILWDKDPVRRYLYVEGGKWIAGPSKLADAGGGDEEVNCSNMHYWAVPDIADWQ